MKHFLKLNALCVMLTVAHATIAMHENATKPLDNQFNYQWSANSLTSPVLYKQMSEMNAKQVQANSHAIALPDASLYAEPAKLQADVAQTPSQPQQGLQLSVPVKEVEQQASQDSMPIQDREGSPTSIDQFPFQENEVGQAKKLGSQQDLASMTNDQKITALKQDLKNAGITTSAQANDAQAEQFNQILKQYFPDYELPAGVTVKSLFSDGKSATSSVGNLSGLLAKPKINVEGSKNNEVKVSKINVGNAVIPVDPVLKQQQLMQQKVTDYLNLNSVAQLTFMANIRGQAEMGEKTAIKQEADAQFNAQLPQLRLQFLKNYQDIAVQDDFDSLMSQEMLRQKSKMEEQAYNNQETSIKQAGDKAVTEFKVAAYKQETVNKKLDKIVKDSKVKESAVRKSAQDAYKKTIDQAVEKTFPPKIMNKAVEVAFQCRDLKLPMTISALELSYLLSDPKADKQAVRNVITQVRSYMVSNSDASIADVKAAMSNVLDSMKQNAYQEASNEIKQAGIKAVTLLQAPKNSSTDSSKS